MRLLGFLILCAGMMLGCGQSGPDSDEIKKQIESVRETGRGISPAGKEDVAAEDEPKSETGLLPGEILGNPEYLAFCYGGYRETSRQKQPTQTQLIEDMRILHAIGVRLIRTYNTQQFAQASNLLAAIDQLKKENPQFEMYVMLGAWIDCENAWTTDVNHDAENAVGNQQEIDAAVKLANQYPDIVKMIAVGNESMVHWATNYYVRPGIILKWVKHLKKLRADGSLPNVWITSSDNYASWGGGEENYHCDDLEQLIRAVDFVSLHTYPFHLTHYEPEFWGVPQDEEALSDWDQNQKAIERARGVAARQFERTAKYVDRISPGKPLCIGETGWASRDNRLFGAEGVRAADELKASLYHDEMRKWSADNKITCFYFEAFDEQWKDQGDPNGSENHFGLINLQGQAKYTLWDEVQNGSLKGLTRDGKAITMTFGGDKSQLMAGAMKVPLLLELAAREIRTVNSERKLGDPVQASELIIVHQQKQPTPDNKATWPAAPLKLNVWESTCELDYTADKFLHIKSGVGPWWGCSLEFGPGQNGEDLTSFSDGTLHLEMRGDAETKFDFGFQTGAFADGTQVSYFSSVGPDESAQLKPDWQTLSIPLSKFQRDPDGKVSLKNVTALFFVRGKKDVSREIEFRNISYRQNSKRP